MNIELGKCDLNSPVYDKEHLLINGTGTLAKTLTGKYHDLYRRAGKNVGVQAKGQDRTEQPPIDHRSLLP